MKPGYENPEARLSPQIADWLRKLKAIVYAEVPWCGRSIDLVGIADQRIIAVELKVSFTAHLMRQAMLNQLVTQESWMAAPTRPSKKSIERAVRYGVGILRIRPLSIEIICDPSQRKHVFLPHAEQVLQFCKLDVPSDRGGLANLKGRGPAQLVHANLIKYLKDHPMASWRDLYLAIPNHYASVRSMSGSMGQLFKWKKVELSISIGKGRAARYRKFGQREPEA